MAWIYLAALEVFPTPYENGLSQSHIAKSTHIVKESCLVVYPTDHSIMCQFGMISRRYRMMGEIGPPSTSFMEDFPARILALLDMEKAWKESEADCFSRSCAWPKKSSPHSYSLKMCQQSQQEEEFKSLMKLPRWGMIVDGVLYPLHPWGRCIDAKDGSYWPTPTSRDATRNKGGSPADWKRNSPNLPTAILKMPTPTASQASKPIRQPSPSRMKGEYGEDLQDTMGRLNPEYIGKRLSVRFVECLMGYPSMWSSLEPWVIQWFQIKQKKRSKS